MASKKSRYGDLGEMRKLLRCICYINVHKAETVPTSSNPSTGAVQCELAALLTELSADPIPLALALPAVPCAVVLAVLLLPEDVDVVPEETVLEVVEFVICVELVARYCSKVGKV
jgi:hypothetical protein